MVGYQESLFRTVDITGHVVSMELQQVYIFRNTKEFGVNTLIPHLAEETDMRLLVTHALPTGHGGGIIAALLGV